MIWSMLKNSCEEDAGTASAILEAAGVTVPQKSLTLIIDEQGIYYRIPIACINDPAEYSFDPQAKKRAEKEAPVEIMLNEIKVRSVVGDKTLAISNHSTILDLKHSYIT